MGSHVKSHKYFSESIKNNTLFPFTSKCQDSYPQPSNCVRIHNKQLPGLNLMHHGGQSVPGMGYWLDRRDEGIYTINLTHYCHLVNLEFLRNDNPLDYNYCRVLTF